MIILAAPHALGAAQHAALSRQPQQCGLQQQSQWASAVGRNRLLGATSDAFQPRCRRRAASRLVTRMGIKAVEAFDGSFTLDPSAEATLKQHLSGHTFCKQACSLAEQLRTKNMHAYQVLNSAQLALLINAGRSGMPAWRGSTAGVLGHTFPASSVERIKQARHAGGGGTVCR